MVKFAVPTSLLPGNSLIEQFAIAGDIGFDAVEVNIGPRFDCPSELAMSRPPVATPASPSGICTHSIHDPPIPDPAEGPSDSPDSPHCSNSRTTSADRCAGAGPSAARISRFCGPGNRPDGLRRGAIHRMGGIPSRRQFRRLPGTTQPVRGVFLRRVGKASTRPPDRAPRPGAGRSLPYEYRGIRHGRTDLAAGSLLGYVHIADNNRLQPGAGCLDFAHPVPRPEADRLHGYVSIECSPSAARSKLTVRKPCFAHPPPSSAINGRPPARSDAMRIVEIREIVAESSRPSATPTSISAR